MNNNESPIQIDDNIETQLLEIAEQYEYNVEGQQEKLYEMASKSQKTTLFRRLFIALFPLLEEDRRVRG